MSEDGLIDAGPTGDGPAEDDGLRRVLDDARRRGIAVEVRRRPDADSLEEAAASLGLASADLAKTIVLRAGAGRYVFAVVPGDASVSWPALRRLLGVNRLTLPSAQEAYDAVGHRRGTITPLGARQAYPVYVDDALAGRRVAMGAGAPRTSLIVDVDDLVRGLGATVAPIAAPGRA